MLPSRSRGKFLTIAWVNSRPSGDCIKYSCSVRSHSKLFLIAQSALINECDSPESKSITVGWPLTRNATRHDGCTGWNFRNLCEVYASCLNGSSLLLVCMTQTLALIDAPWLSARLGEVP